MDRREVQRHSQCSSQHTRVDQGHSLLCLELQRHCQVAGYGRRTDTALCAPNGDGSTQRRCIFSAQSSPDASDQLGRRCRFDDIVVGACLEAGNFVCHVFAGGVDEDRQLGCRSSRTQTAAHLVAVHVGQLDVQ